MSLAGFIVSVLAVAAGPSNSPPPDMPDVSKCSAITRTHTEPTVYVDNAGYKMRLHWHAAWGWIRGDSDRIALLRDCSTASMICVQIDDEVFAVDKTKAASEQGYELGAYEFDPKCLDYEKDFGTRCRVSLIRYRSRATVVNKWRPNGYFIYVDGEGIIAIGGLDGATIDHWAFKSGTPLLDPTWGTDQSIWCILKEPPEAVKPDDGD